MNEYNLPDNAFKHFLAIHHCVQFPLPVFTGANFHGNNSPIQLPALLANRLPRRWSFPYSALSFSRCEKSYPIICYGSPRLMALWVTLNMSQCMRNIFITQRPEKAHSNLSIRNTRRARILRIPQISWRFLHWTNEILRFTNM